MKKRKTQCLLLVASAALASGLLAGCGHSSVNPYNLDWSESTNGVEINFWTPFGSDIEVALEDIIATFTEKTGIKVSCESKGGYDNLESAVTGSASTGTMPEVTLAYPDHEAAYLDNNSLVKLDYYFENDGDDSFAISDFYSDYMKENQTLEFKDDGTPYTLGIPFNKSTEVLCYNKTFFDWAKTQDATIAVPTTWNEVQSVGVKIVNVLTPAFGHVIGTDNKIYANPDALPSTVDPLLDFSSVAASDFHPFSYDSQSNYFISTVRQWGGTYTTYDATSKKGYVAFDSQETKDGLQFMKDTYKAGSVIIPANVAEAKYTSSEFKLLKEVMVVGSSAGVKNQVSTGGAFDTACAPVPVKDASKKYVISQGTNLVMLDQGTNAQRLAAWKLIKYLSKEANGLFASETGYFPSCEYATNSAEYQAFVNKKAISSADKLDQACIKVNTEYYMNSSAGWTKFVDPGFVGSSTIRESVTTVMARLFVDNLTPEAAIKEQYASLGDYVK